MALEALAWLEPPALLDAEDGGQAYNLGIRFQVTEPVTCAGVEWYKVPAALSTPPGGTHVASIWNDDDQQLARAAFVPVAGADQHRVLFDAPLNLVPGVDYIAAVYTIHYVFRASGGVYPSTPSGKAVGLAGRLVAYNGGPDVVPASSPSGTTSALFYVSPLIDLGGAPEPEIHTTAGAATLAVTATAARATARPARGRAALTATATAARSTTRPRAGAASIVVTAAAARSTARTTAGRAALVVTATAVTPEQHTTTGRAACSVTARAARATARGTAGSAPVYVTARRVPPTGRGAGPRLVTNARRVALTSASRPGVIATSTRG